SSGRDVEGAGLEPDTIRIRHPKTVIFQVDVSDEVFATPSIRIEAVGEIAEGSDRHKSPFIVRRWKTPTFSREPSAQAQAHQNSRCRFHTSIFRRPSFPKPRNTCHDR